MFQVEIMDKAQNFRTITIIDGFFTYTAANNYARSLTLMPYECWQVNEQNNPENDDLVMVCIECDKVH